MVAVSSAPAIRARSLHRPEAAVVSAEATADKPEFRFDSTDQPEFDRWRWVDFWTPVREVVYFKRRVYARALHELGKLMFNEGLPPYPDWWANLDIPVAKARAG